MASGDIAAPTEWAIRTDKVFVSFQVEDAGKVQVVFEDQKVTFSAVQYEINEQGHPTKKVSKSFRNDLDLYGKVIPEKCVYQQFGRVIKCLLMRAEEGSYWPRLSKEKQRIHWLKVDFARWKDEDDSDTEDKLDQDFDMNKMLGELRMDQDGNKKGIEDFDDLEDAADSDDEEIEIEGE